MKTKKLENLKTKTIPKNGLRSIIGGNSQEEDGTRTNGIKAGTPLV